MAMSRNFEQSRPATMGELGNRISLKIKFSRREQRNCMSPTFNTARFMNPGNLVWLRYSASTNVALAMPPPSHIVCSP